MLTSILSLVAGAATIIGGVIAYKNSANRQRRAAEKDVAEKESVMQSKKDEIRQAVYGNDEAKINAISARLLAPLLLSLLLSPLVSTLFSPLATSFGLLSRLLSPHLCGAACCVVLLGCASKPPAVQYIPTDRRIEPCTNSLGIACQAVPNAVFCEFLEKAQELKDLRTEMSVDKRLQK